MPPPPRGVCCCCPARPGRTRPATSSRADSGAQLEQALLNVALAVRAGGGEVSHLVRLRVYVVDWDPSKIEEFMAGGAAAFAQLPGLPRTAVTLVGVQSLFTPDILVEVEAEAVVPAA